MNLAEVRRWARRRRISAARFRRAHDGALLHVASRLVQAMMREGIGSLAVPMRTLPFRRLEVTALPRHLRTLPGLVGALRPSFTPRQFNALRHDLENSVANVVLNRLLGASRRAIEPAYQGHQYWPFPALRVGPSLQQILACSHLTRGTVALPLLEVDECRLVSSRFNSFPAFMRAWSGLRDPLVPVHPWQLELSPVVKDMLRNGAAKASPHTVQMIPLASQRTCRVVSTAYDVKLPVDATLTGEHRLLYRLNRENAPLVSALAEELLHESDVGTLAFQGDVASVFHPLLGDHLSAIVREPVRARRGEQLVPAINLWSGRHEARALLKRVALEQFFECYCRVLMEGPVLFYKELGMAFEPHLQNVYVGLRDGVPVRVVLRDLDNSILDRRLRSRLRALGEPARDTWTHMPAYEDGGRRLVQALLYGHLGEVMLRLADDHGADERRLVSIVDAAWDRLGAQHLRGWAHSVKTTLRTRLRRGTALRFVAA